MWYSMPHGVARGRRTALAAAWVVGALAGVPEPGAAQEVQGIVAVHLRSEGRPVPAATVESGTIRAFTDTAGTAQLTLAVGQRRLIVAKLGFASETLQVMVRSGHTDLSVSLHEAAVELGEIVVSATRDERRVSDEPTRVEVTDRDDIEEEITAAPAIIAELLTEAGGVRALTTSGGLGGASIRVRGLRGRYTQLLSDGLPLFGLTTEALGPLQIPPMDLQRIEVIKGVASALYGPTALGGVVNLVSQFPNGRREVLVNQTSRGGTDAVLWDARPLTASWGYTLLASANRQTVGDLDADGWADIPGYRRGVVRPRVFWYDSRGNSWFLTTGLTAETRDGGTVAAGVVADGLPFGEGLDTWRADLGTVGRVRLNPGLLLSLRGSATGEWRDRAIGTVRERDRRNTLFTEAAFTVTRGSQVVVLGAAAQRDAYHALDVPLMDYDFVTPGLFVEHTWSPAVWFGLSSSARLDLHSSYGAFLNPRVSALFRAGSGWNARLSAGTGIFAPTPFTEETEVIGLSHLRPITGLRVERARGASLDVEGMLGPVEINGSVHGSVIDDPLALRPVLGSTTDVELVNAGLPTRTGGAELFARYRLEPLSFTTAYFYLHGTELDVESGIRREVPLNPRHAAGLAVVWEREGDEGTRAGLETFYTGRQALANDPYRAVSEPYLTIDALIQWRFGSVLAFLHGEDLNDERQTRFDSLLLPVAAPGGHWTTDVWAPLSGRVVNFGLRLRL